MRAGTCVTGRVAAGRACVRGAGLAGHAPPEVDDQDGSDLICWKPHAWRDRGFGGEKAINNGMVHMVSGISMKGMAMPAPTFMAAPRSTTAPRAHAAAAPTADARQQPIAPTGPTIRPRLSQTAPSDVAAPQHGVPVQRMFKGFFGGWSKKEEPKEPLYQSSFGSSPIPMSDKNMIPEGELRETNQRQAKILANETKGLRDKFIAPHERRVNSLLATSKAGEGSPIGDNDYSQSAFDGVMQGMSENMLEGTKHYHAHTQSMMDRASTLGSNTEFDDFHSKYVKGDIK
jgi:hypothetical protein